MSEPTLEQIEQWWRQAQLVMLQRYDEMAVQWNAMVIALEDTGFLNSSYEDALLEPEWDVFI